MISDKNFNILEGSETDTYEFENIDDMTKLKITSYALTNKGDQSDIIYCIFALGVKNEQQKF